MNLIKRLKELLQEWRGTTVEENKFSPTSTFNKMLLQAAIDDITFEDFRKRIEIETITHLWDEKSKAEIFSYLDKTIAESKVKPRTYSSSKQDLLTATINIDGSQLDELSKNLTKAQHEIEETILLLDEANVRSKALHQFSKEFNIPFDVLKKENSEFEKNFIDIKKVLASEEYSKLLKENLKHDSFNAAMHAMPIPLLSWPEIKEKLIANLSNSGSYMTEAFYGVPTEYIKHETSEDNQEFKPINLSHGLATIRLPIDESKNKILFNFNGFSEEDIFELVDNVLESSVKRLADLQKGKTYGDALRALEKIDRENKGSFSYKERTYSSIARESQYILEDKMRMKLIK